MDGSTTAWAVLFTDGTLKRRGFHNFRQKLMAESEPPLCTYFRSQIAISESRSVYCTSHSLSTVQKVVLSHCTIRFAVCAGSQSNNPRFVTALLSALLNSHRLCEGLCISRLFLLLYFGPPRESGFWFFEEIIKPSNVIGLLPTYRFYHLVRCRNCDSSLIPYFLLFRLYG